MALLDWMKNRGQQSPAAEPRQQKPETAKEMYTREAGQEKTARRPVEQMPDEAKAQARQTGALLDKATQHMNSDRSPQAPAGGSESPEASRQNMSHQDKAAHDLSPTSAQAGTPAHEQDSPSVSGQTPESVKPDKTPSPMPETPAPSRSRGGWER
jgi:hypothetical protein